MVSGALPFVVLLSIYIHFTPASSTAVPYRTLEHYASSSGVKPENLYSILDDNRTITVHIVPHTHDDVSWLKIVDEYYYGGMYHTVKSLWYVTNFKNTWLILKLKFSL